MSVSRKLIFTDLCINGNLVGLTLEGAVIECELSQLSGRLVETFQNQNQIFDFNHSIYRRQLALNIGEGKHLELDVQQHLSKFTVSESFFQKPFEGLKWLFSTANGSLRRMGL